MRRGVKAPLQYEVSGVFALRILTIKFDVGICRSWCMLTDGTELGTSRSPNVFGEDPKIYFQFCANPTDGPGGKWARGFHPPFSGVFAPVR